MAAAAMVRNIGVRAPSLFACSLARSAPSLFQSRPTCGRGYGRSAAGNARALENPFQRKSARLKGWSAACKQSGGSSATGWHGACSGVRDGLVRLRAERGGSMARVVAFLMVAVAVTACSHRAVREDDQVAHMSEFRMSREDVIEVSVWKAPEL